MESWRSRGLITCRTGLSHRHYANIAWISLNYNCSRSRCHFKLYCSQRDILKHRQISLTNHRWSFLRLLQFVQFAVCWSDSLMNAKRCDSEYRIWHFNRSLLDPECTSVSLHLSGMVKQKYSNGEDVLQAVAVDALGLHMYHFVKFLRKYFSLALYNI